MTAVPPPVPPEIVRPAAAAIERMNDGTAGEWEVAETVLAAVYGDIVEAARRDALDQMTQRIRDEAGLWRTSKRAALWRIVRRRPVANYPDGLLDAARIVTDLRDATAPRTAPAATQADQQTESAPAPVRDAEGPHKRSQPFLTNAFAVAPEMGRYLHETAPPRTPPCFTALDGTEEPTDD